jgi:hypothetical protein
MGVWPGQRHSDGLDEAVCENRRLSLRWFEPMTQTGSVAEGRLSDWISLGVLASWVPRDAVDEATGKGA